jgi:tetratricopeptide (TPR) repeat protein
LGRKVRELRLLRGLTQSDLAGDDFTSGFISLLETGRTRPSLRAAGILAQRLGVPVAELMASAAPSESNLEIEVLRGEQELSAGRANEALQVIGDALRRATGPIRARALRSHGRALLEVGRPREALKQLEAATHAFEALDQRELVLRSLYDRAVAHARLDEPGNALTLALECETAMKTRGFVDRTLELQLRSLLAAIFGRMGDDESADYQAQRALALANDVVDTEALAQLYSTLSVTRQREGDLDSALSYAKKSLSLFEELGREHAIGQLWHNLASVYLRRKDYPRAADALEHAERVASRAKVGSLDARLLSLRAQLAADRRQSEAARKFARAAVDHPASSAKTRGRAWLTLARVAAAQKEPLAELRRLLDAAVKAFATEPPRVRAEAHSAYAAILAGRGQWKDAYLEAQRTLELGGLSLR